MKLLDLQTRRAAARKASGFERAHACAVFSPFVLPKGLVVPVNIDPVGLHISQGVTCTIGRKKPGDVRVSSGGITV